MVMVPPPPCGCGPVGSIGSHGSPPLPCEWELGVYSLPHQLGVYSLPPMVMVPPHGHGSPLHPVDVGGGWVL